MTVCVLDYLQQYPEAQTLPEHSQEDPQQPRSCLRLHDISLKIETTPVPTSLLSSIFYWLFFDRGRLWSGSTLERKFCQLISHLLRTSFLLGTKFSKEPLLPILFLVEVILSATYFGHIILLSSSWGLKHQSKESQDLILLNTYLNIFFKIFRKTSTSVWTSSHFEELSNQPPFLKYSPLYIRSW